MSRRIQGPGWELTKANEHMARRRVRDLDSYDVAAVLIAATMLLVLAVALAGGS